ncbi:MAG: LamG-like jellyroll fold domain-containing protein [Chloroflexota bacterium]
MKQIRTNRQARDRDKQSNIPIFALMALILVLIASAFNLPTQIAAAISPYQQLVQAWTKAGDIGRYDYRSTAQQITYPAPALANIGQPPKKDNLAAQGQFDNLADELSFTFWLDGSFNPDTAIDVRSDGEKTWSRQGQGEWEEVQDVSGTFAPNGDPLAFLNGMRNIQDAGPDIRAFPNADIELVFHRYTFDFDGQAFGRYIVLETAENMRQKGELPNGIQLDIPAVYAQATGNGEIWLDEAGLPARLKIDIDYGPQESGELVEAQITTDFFGYDHSRLNATTASLWSEPGSWLTNVLSSLQTPAFQRTLLLSMGFTLFLLLLTLVTIRYWRTREFRTVLACFLILSIVASPLLNAERIDAFGAAREAKAASHEAAQTEATAMQKALESLETTQFDPKVDPLRATNQLDAYSSQAGVSATSIQAAAQINTTDTDGDGLLDVEEIQWLTCVDADENDVCDSDPYTDRDGDGLTDYQEVKLLGTAPTQQDSDGDGIRDDLEVAGFSLGGTTWYLDPTEPDSNKDGVIDGIECFEWSEANPEFDPANPTQLGNCRDTDGDDTPDVFDADNDGDGVYDSVDSSAFNVYTGYTEENPLEVSITKLATDQPVLVTLEMRPENAEELNYFGHVLDWPSEDRAGQIQRISNTTWQSTSVYTSTAPNAANGDMRLLPMLEISIPGESGHFGNLPVLDTAPIARSEGITVGTWLDSDALSGYGVMVHDIMDSNNQPTGDLVAYAPLMPFNNSDGDATAGYAAKMLYQPSQGTGNIANWGTAHEYRLVWLVQMLTDPCPADNPGCDDDERLRDQYSVVHNYYEDWQLTGLNISEQHGLDATIIYEDPAVDENVNVNYPEELYNLAWNLSESFVNGLDCNLVSAANGTCSPDSFRDVTVATMSSAINTWTANAPDGSALVIETPLSYPHKDYLNEIAMTDAKNVLVNKFQANHADKWPTLLFAYEYTERAAGLDEPQASTGASPVFKMSDYDKVTTAGFNWGTYHFADNQWQARALETYLGELDAQLQSNEEYFTSVGSEDGLDNEDDYAAAALGKRTIFQIFYATVHRGVSGIVSYQTGNTTVAAQAATAVNFSDRWSIGLPTTGANIAFAEGVMEEFATSFAKAAINKKKGLDLRLVSANNDIGVTMEFINEGKFWKTFGDSFGAERNPLVSSVDDVDFDFRVKMKGSVNGMAKTAGYVGAAMAVATITAFTLQMACEECAAAAGVVINSVEIASNIIDLASIVRAFAVLKTLQQGATFTKTLTSIANSAAGSAVLTVVIAVITLAVLWTVYLINYVDKSASFAKRMATAFTAAASIVTVVFTLIALVAIAVATTGVVGAVIALVVLVALAILGIWEAICGIDSEVRGDDACTGPISAFTEWVAEALTEVNDVIVNMDSEERLSINFDDISLEYPRRGFVTDNYLNYTIAVTNTLHTYDNDTQAIDARQANFRYTLQTNTNDPYQDLTIGVLPPCDVAHIGSCYNVLGEIGSKEFVYTDYYTGLTRTFTTPIYGIQMNAFVTTTVDLSSYPGINRNVAENLYIGESFSVPFELCDTWLFGVRTDCEFYGTKEESDPDDEPGWSAIPLTAEQSYDILPATVAEFVAGTWAADGEIAWPNQKDLDQDGRLSIEDGGEDPDDTDPDMDDDGLTDAFELDANLDLESDDTDGDGLKDGEELRHNTNPNKSDTDGDGLSDSEEVEGWLYTYDVANNLQTKVWSDPLVRDTDGDLLTDLQESLVSFHPGVKDDPAVVQTLVEISEFDVNESAAPLAIWTMDEAKDAAAFVDRSGQGSTAACTNTTSCPTAGQEGRYGNALDFDGGDSLTATLAKALADRSFTLSAWAKPEAGNSSSYIINHAAGALQFGFANDGTFLCKIPNTTVDAPVPSVGTWHHWACTHDGTTLKIFRDGSQVDNEPANSVYNSSGPVDIGQSFKGLLDEVAIYGDVLSDDEIVGLARGGYNLDDRIVRAGAAVDYSVTLTNTASTGASGILVNELNNYDPLVEAPNVVLHMDATEVITTFVNSTNDTFAATCGIDTCPVPADDDVQPPVGKNLQYGSAGKLNWTGQLMSFDGEDDVITIPQLAIGPRVVIGMWVRLESLPAANEKSYLLYSEPGTGYSLYIDANGFVHYDNGIDDQILVDFQVTDTIPDNTQDIDQIKFVEGEWRHILITTSTSDWPTEAGAFRISWPYNIYSVQDLQNDRTPEGNVISDILNPIPVPHFGPGLIGNNAAGDGAFHGQIAQFAYYQSAVEAPRFLFSSVSEGTTWEEIRDEGDYIFEGGCAGNEACEVAPTLLLKFEDLGNKSLTGVRNSVNSTAARCETSASCPQTTTDAKFGEALNFDDSDYLTLDGIELDNRSFTIATWAKRSTTGQSDYIVGQGRSARYQGLHFGFRSDNAMTCAFFGTGLNTAAYTDSDWHHWACSYDAATKTRRIFRDGVEVAKDTAAANYQGSGPLYVGQRWDGQHFNGSLDEFMIIPNAVVSEVGAQVLMGGTYPFSEIDRTVQTFTLDAGSSLVVSGTATLDDEAASQVQQLWQQVDATLDGNVSSDAITTDADLMLYLPLNHNVNAIQMVDLANTPDGNCIVNCPTGGYMGPVDRSAFFDGVNDAFHLDDIVPTSNQPTTLTFSAWVKAERGTILDIREMGNRSRGDFIGWNGLEVDVDGAKLHGRNQTLYVPYNLGSNEWSHLTVVIDKPSDWRMTVYVNGSEAGQQTVASSEITSIGAGQATIGVQKNLAHLLKGHLDEVRLYSTAMSAAQAAEHYEASRALLYLPLDEDENATSVASEFGGVGIPTENLGLGIDGRLDNAANFGTQNYITLEGVDSLNQIDDAVTVMAWVKPESLTGRQSFISTGRAGARGMSFGLNGNKLRFTLFGVNDIDDTLVSITPDLWQHVAVTYHKDNGTQFYINGAVSGAFSSVGAIQTVDSTPEAILVGALTRNNGEIGEFFNGAIDELVVYNRELTNEEVESAFNWQFRTYREVSDARITVDADAPSVALKSAATYRADYTTWLSLESAPSDALLQVEAIDSTSPVVRVEVGQKGPSDANTTWRDAPACIDAAADGHWCALFRPDGEGAYQMQFRAVDAVGNRTTNASTNTIYVDTTPPVMTLDSAFNNALLNASRPDGAELRWILPLSGTISDPNISGTGQAGSGVSATEVAIVVKDAAGDVVGNGSQRATVNETNGTWQVDFEFLTVPAFGDYTVEAVAVDKLGNRIAADTQIGSFQLDERAPSVKYMVGSVDGLPFNTSLRINEMTDTADTVGMTPSAISGTLSVGGLVTSGADWPGATAFYHFEDDDVTASIQDASGNSLVASCVNCPSPAAGSSPYGQALSFDGVDDYVSVPHLHNPVDGAFSAMAWFNVADLATTRYILQQEDGSGNTGRSWLYVAANGKLATFLGGSRLPGSSTVSTGQWHHAAVTYDGKTLSLYLNGQLESSQERTLEASDGNMLIGSHKSFNPKFKGSIDEVAIYRRSLLESQIYAAARQPLSTITSVEARLTKFDDGNNTTPATAIDWTPATLGSANSTITDWSFTEDDNTLEGYYKLDIRSSDSSGNVELGSTIWRGRIDRVAPEIAVTTSDISNGNLTYSFTATDMMLDTETLVHPCGSAEWVRKIYTNNNTILTGVLYELSISCTLSQVEAITESVTICDAAGNCTTGSAESVNSVLTRPDTYANKGKWILDVAAPGVLSNDYDIDGNSLTSSAVVNEPAHGSLTLGSDGSFVYKPTDPTFAGNDSFTYRASNGDDIGDATVTINVTPSNPLLYLPLDDVGEPPQNYVSEFAAFGHPDLMADCVAIAEGCPISGETGEYGTAINFGNQQGYIGIPNAAGMLGNVFTASAWVKIPSLTAFETPQHIFQPGGSFGWLMVQPSTGKIRTDMGGRSFESQNGVTAGQWHHVVVVYDIPDVRIYLDGQLEIQDRTEIRPNNGSLLIGFNEGLNSIFNGVMDEVVLFNRPFTDDEILMLATPGNSAAADIPIADLDADNVADAIEDGAPNNGDGNNDGTPDSRQAHVTSLPAASGISGEYVTLAAPDGTELVNVSVSANAPAAAPNGVTFPIGHLDFGVQSVPVGGAIAVTIYPADMAAINSYYKYGPTVDNTAPHWYEFLYDGTTGAELLADRIVLHFVDGGRGDADLTANGVIVDPSAPALRLSPTALDEVDEPMQTVSTIFLPVISNEAQVASQVKAQSVDSNEGADTVASLQPEEVTQQILLPILINQ